MSLTYFLHLGFLSYEYENGSISTVDICVNGDSNINLCPTQSTTSTSSVPLLESTTIETETTRSKHTILLTESPLLTFLDDIQTSNESLFTEINEQNLENGIFHH